MKDSILHWNEVALEANRLDHTGDANPVNQRGPTLSSRALALAHLAMHDAFFAVNGVATIPGPDPAGGKRLYLAVPPVFGGVNSLAARSSAVTGAASTVLSALYPAQQARIHQACFPLHAENGYDQPAFEFGRTVGVEILKLRADADMLAKADRDYSPAIGKLRHREDPMTPSQGFLGVAYGKSKTLAVDTWQSLAPFPVGTTYSTHLHEVYKFGGAPSQPGNMRTPNQTMIGLFWAYDGPAKIGTPPRLYNQVLRAVAARRNNTEVHNARLFALANAAMGDSGVHAWHFKYCYDLWRPVVGIREADPSTGPSATPAQAINTPCDPFWKPLGAPKTNEPKPSFTPNFPAYPSGHATFGAAAFEMARLFYRHRDNLNFSDTQVDNIGFDFVSEEADGISTDDGTTLRTRHLRKYASLAEAIYENSISRIFLGVHWRFDGTTGSSTSEMLEATDNRGGVPLGLNIARNIYTSGMQQQATPPGPPAGPCSTPSTLESLSSAKSSAKATAKPLAKKVESGRTKAKRR